MCAVRGETSSEIRSVTLSVNFRGSIEFSTLCVSFIDMSDDSCHIDLHSCLSWTKLSRFLLYGRRTVIGPFKKFS